LGNTCGGSGNGQVEIQWITQATDPGVGIATFDHRAVSPVTFIAKNCQTLSQKKSKKGWLTNFLKSLVQIGSKSRIDGRAASFRGKEISGDFDAGVVRFWPAINYNQAGLR
jgi:hypothetical protein